MYPRLFELGRVVFPTYGVFAAIALIAGLTLGMRTAARLGVAPAEMWNFGLLTIFTAVLGTRLLLIARYLHDFVRYPMLMLSITTPRTIDSVLTELGLGACAGLSYMTWKRMPWLRTLDAATPAWALGEAILLLGCFFAGCDYGRPTTVSWGIAFHSRWAILWNGTPLNIRLHPVQLYLCAMQLALCFGLSAALTGRRQAGELAGAYFMLSGIGQFFLDFYRGGNRLLIFSGAFSLTQALAFCMFVLGALLLLQHNTPDMTQKTTPVRV